MGEEVQRLLRTSSFDWGADRRAVVAGVWIWGEEGLVGREIRGPLETRGVRTLCQVQWEAFKTMGRFKTEVQYQRLNVSYYH